ncbi:MAG: OmpA family protein [Gammaproteobacteria bacterium]|nr:OmpA family protein [Gammaproteobacteria bacterium]
MMKYRRLRLRSFYFPLCAVLISAPISVLLAAEPVDTLELSPWSITGSLGVSGLAPQENNSGLLITDKQATGYSLAVDYLWREHFLLSGFYLNAGGAEVSNGSVLLGALDYQYVGSSVSWFPLSARPVFSPYLKSGLHVTQNSVDNPQIKYSQDQAINTHFGVGATWKFSRDWHFLVDATTFGKDAYFASVGVRYQLFNETKIKEVLDADRDGVPDVQDRCLTSSSGVPVDAFGCELDSDGDGIKNSQDRCENSAANSAVDAKGCVVVLDSDGDGVPDSRDCCPNTALGKTVDEYGCAIIEIDLSNSDIPFEFGSEKLSAIGEKIWANIAKQIKQFPNVIVELGGHTDSKGSATFNQKFSLKRAKTVEAFLTSKGVQAKQLRVQGYGESQPIADNRTEEGRRSNRRVEAHIVQQLKMISEAELPAVCKQRFQPPVLENVETSFEAYGFQRLSESAKQAWGKVAQQLKQNPQLKVELAGYTDSSGAAELNLQLSQQRAETVRDYLISVGVSEQQLTAKGYGESNPIADNLTPEGRKKNRRVVLYSR